MAGPDAASLARTGRLRRILRRIGLALAIVIILAIMAGEFIRMLAGASVATYKHAPDVASNHVVYLDVHEAKGLFLHGYTKPWIAKAFRVVDKAENYGLAVFGILVVLNIIFVVLHDFLMSLWPLGPRALDDLRGPI